MERTRGNSEGISKQAKTSN